MKLLSSEDIAGLFRLTKRQVAERVTTRKDFPKPYVIGGARRWAETEVLAWLEQRKA